MPKPQSHPRYQAVARSEPYPSNTSRTRGGNNHGGGHGHTSSGRGSMGTGSMYQPAGPGSVSTAAGVTPGVSPAQQQSAAPQPNFGYGPNTGIGIGAGSGIGPSGMINLQYRSEFPAMTTTSSPQTIPRNFGQQSSPLSASSTYSLQGPNQNNSSPSSAPNFQLTGYQHHQPLQQPLQKPLQHQSLQHHPQHQRHQQQPQHQNPTIANQNVTHHQPNYFRPQSQQHQNQPPQQNQQHQVHQPPNQPHPHHPHHSQPSNPHPHSPSLQVHNINPTTPWTPQEDALLLSSRSSHLPWSELQRLHFPGKTANACRKRHERLIEKQQAEEEVDEDRLARIAGEYVAMREEMWRGLAERMRLAGVDMGIKEVEENCLGLGVGRLRVGSRQGGRRREGRRQSSYPIAAGLGMGTASGMGAAAGMTGTGAVSTTMPMMLGAGQGQGRGEGPSQGQSQGNAEEGRNYTHSPVQMGSTGTGMGQSPTGPGPASAPAPGMMGMGHGMTVGMGMLPPQTAPPLTTLVPISSSTTGHGFTSTLPTPSAPGMAAGIPPPPLSLMQQQHQPRVAFGGYLNGRSSSTARRQTAQSMGGSSTSASPTNIINPAGANASYPQVNVQWHQHHATNQDQGVTGSRTGTGAGIGGFGHGQGYAQAAPVTGATGASWSNVGTYPPSSFG